MWLDMTCFGKTSDELTEIFAKEYGLAIGNGAHYGKQADGYMRLNIGCARGILQKGLDQMAKMYADYINKQGFILLAAGLLPGLFETAAPHTHKRRKIL